MSNLLTLSRGPLAICFLTDNVNIRLFLIIAALITDGLDGYIARRFKSSSLTGVFLDPILDKFFASFVFGVLASEGRLAAWQLFALLSRDFYSLGFIIYMSVLGDWQRYQCRAVWSSKLITVLQFLVMVGLTSYLVFPDYVYYSFLVLGFFALLEQFLGYIYYTRDKSSLASAQSRLSREVTS
ncbi:MAG: CDP-alcohol phosphatidyltransferase family protein [Chlamydiota bacterium]